MPNSLRSAELLKQALLWWAADEGGELLASAMNLLLTPICLAEEAVKEEANGELGPTEVDPAGLAKEAVLQATHVLHAETLETACNVSCRTPLPSPAVFDLSMSRAGRWRALNEML